MSKCTGCSACTGPFAHVPLTEGEECVKAYDEYAARHMGRKRSFLARLADSVRGQK